MSEVSSSDCEINVHDVKKAVKHLKQDKSDGDKGLMSNMILNAPVEWYRQLAKLFTAMNIHGHYCKELCKATICSLPKDLRSNLCDDKNYRGIALSSAINKVFDWIILVKFKDGFATSDLQFAYKQGMSTSLCTLTMKEIATYYTSKRGHVYAALLDASKAFDRLRYDKLFEILLTRNLPPDVLRLLFDMYENQLCRTRWESADSMYFSTINGIRQGGVASPILFTLYMEELIKKLEEKEVGCHIGREYFGCLVYADDVTLLAPTASALQKMLNTCEEFGAEFDVCYNPEKSVCISFGDANVNPAMSLCGKNLKWQNEVKHLGNIINCKLDDCDDICSKKCDFISRVNAVNTNYASAPWYVRKKLLISKCCSFYGSQIWRLDKVSNLVVCWRKAARRVLRIPYKSRSVLIPPLLECMSLDVQFVNRFLKLVNTVLNGKNCKLKALFNSRPQFGVVNMNLNWIEREFNVLKIDVTNGIPKRVNVDIDEALKNRVGQIIEFF